ncbi:MAG TPA: XRE family transcriptional regulator [Polyangiaceae bacterium]
MSTENHERRFAGFRLRLARSFKDLTQAELGKRASVTPQYIGHLENGHKQPASILVDALADILGFDEPFFYGGQLEEFRDEECHFRRRTTTPVTVRTRVLAHGSLFGSLVAYLDDNVSMPPEKLSLGSLQSPEDIERAAERCRMAWGLGRDLPIKNLTRAVENAGVVVTRFEAASLKIDAFSRAGKRSVVVLNAEKDSHTRSRFDLAHECGHLVGHGGITTGDPDTEKQANRFAGALLLPRSGFVRDFPRSRTVDWAALFALKLRWGASVSGIVKRAYELRLIPATTYQAAFKHLAYRGWIKREPEELAPETPELVPLCLQEIERAQGLSPMAVAARLGWRVDNFRLVAGVPISEPDPPIEPTGKIISLAQERSKRSA